MPPELDEIQETQCLYTRFPLPNLLCTEYSVKLIFFYNGKSDFTPFPYKFLEILFSSPTLLLLTYMSNFNFLRPVVSSVNYSSIYQLVMEEIFLYLFRSRRVFHIVEQAKISFLIAQYIYQLHALSYIQQGKRILTPHFTLLRERGRENIK